MQLSMPHHNLVEPTVTIFRLLTVALAAIAFALSGQLIDLRLVPVSVAYVVAIGVLWLLAPRLSWTWLLYPMALIDVGVIAAIIRLSPESSLPLWSLYLFPLASTTAIGRMPAVAAAALSIISYLTVTWFTTGAVSLLAVWQVTVLVAATALITILTRRWMVERHEKRAWQEIAVATRGLIGGDEPEDVAAVVADRTRRLVRADRAWVWWCDQDGRLRPSAQAGKAPEEPLVPGELAPALMNKLDHGMVCLDEFGGPFADLVGEVILLRGESGRIALLAVSWNKPPGDRAAQRQRLRVFAPWAADALAQSKAKAASCEELRLAYVLENAASDLAGTFDLQAAREIIVDAAREGLGAAISLVERSSGRVLTGDVEVTEALVRLTVAEGATRDEANVPDPAAREPDTPLIVPIEENLALIAWRMDPKLDALDCAWLDQLAEVGRIAMERCSEHERLQSEERRLLASLEALPAPVAIRDVNGTLCSPTPLI